MQVRFPASSLPVLNKCDVFVLGCGFAGMAAALKLAAVGKSVVVVEPRTYPAREMAATGRPFIDASLIQTGSLPAPLQTAFVDSRDAERQGYWTFHEDTFKKTLEDVLRTAGVKTYYASVPVGLVRAEDDGIAGVVIGNKSGRQVIRCTYVLDTSETALIPRLLGEKFVEPPLHSLYSRCLEFVDVAVLPDLKVTVQLNGLVSQELNAYPGLGGNGHYYVEYQLELPRAEDTALDLTRRDRAARLKGLAIVEHLKQHHPAFAEAMWASSSHEMKGPVTTVLAGPTPERGIPQIQLRTTAGGTQAITGNCFAVQAPRVYMVNQAARVPVEFRRDWSEPEEACCLGAALAELVQTTQGVVAMAPIPAAVSNDSMQFRAQKQPQRGVDYEWVNTPAAPIHTPEPREITVVGGGTAGGISCITAGRLGKDTLLVDMNPGLGGTGTYGGIHAYWFGWRDGFSGQVTDMVNELHRRTGHPIQKGTVPQWNIECKIHALLQAAYESEVDLLLNAMFIGSLTAGTSVRGVVIATRYGPIAILSQVTIDATGDGDIAAFAGAPYVLGSERDHSLMYGYMAQVIRPGRPRNVKTRSVDITNIEDYTRGIMAERRSGQEGDVDHGIYFAPRESRHIKADLTMTLSDQLVRRAFEDVVLLSFSNNDIKGQSTSDWVLMGLQSPHVDIEIPYRALLPVGLEGVIVSGKAFSATHDALAAPRMQPDMENLGGIAALAASISIDLGVNLRQLPVRALQERLVDTGTLPARILNRELQPLQFSKKELGSKLSRIDPQTPLHRFSLMKNNVRYDGRVDLADLMCMGSEVVPFLEQQYVQSKGRMSLLLAQVLAVLGSRKGVTQLVEACLTNLQEDRLPTQNETIMYKGIPPDQNAASDVAFLIYSLGLARDEMALPVWQRVVELLAHETPADIMDKDRAMYYYVTAVCYGIERLGDARCVDMLKQLHKHEAFRQRHSLSPDALEEDYVDERLAYLELLIARCLARCGSPSGYLSLIDYLQDARAIHAEHAHTELINITGEDFGKNQARWSDWLEQYGENLPCAPFTEVSDPVKAWSEEIQIDPIHEEAMQQLAADD